MSGIHRRLDVISNSETTAPLAHTFAVDTSLSSPFLHYPPRLHGTPLDRVDVASAVRLGENLNPASPSFTPSISPDTVQAIPEETISSVTVSSAAVSPTAAPSAVTSSAAAPSEVASSTAAPSAAAPSAAAPSAAAPSAAAPSAAASSAAAPSAAAPSAAASSAAASAASAVDSLAADYSAAAAADSSAAAAAAPPIIEIGKLDKSSASEARKKAALKVAKDLAESVKSVTSGGDKVTNHELTAKSLSSVPPLPLPPQPKELVNKEKGWNTRTKKSIKGTNKTGGLKGVPPPVRNH